MNNLPVKAHHEDGIILFDLNGKTHGLSVKLANKVITSDGVNSELTAQIGIDLLRGADECIVKRFTFDDFAIELNCNGDVFVCGRGQQ